MKQEKPDWLAVNQVYSKRFARFAGRLGVDKIAIRKGATRRIVVRDLLRRPPIWFGGQDRAEERMDEFFTWLGPRKSEQIRLAVMDM